MIINKVNSFTSNGPQVAGLFSQLISGVTDLIDVVSSGCDQSVDFEGVLQSLGVVPLTTEEYALAKLRVANAQAYAAQGEWGAAQYELTMALNRLNRVAER